MITSGYSSGQLRGQTVQWMCAIPVGSILPLRKWVTPTAKEHNNEIIAPATTVLSVSGCSTKKHYFMFNYFFKFFKI